MKAHDMREAIHKTESEIRDEIADLVSDKLRQLANDTGLHIGDVIIRTMAARALRDPFETPHVTDVEIEARLPD